MILEILQNVVICQRMGQSYITWIIHRPKVGLLIEYNQHKSVSLYLISNALNTTCVCVLIPSADSYIGTRFKINQIFWEMRNTCVCKIFVGNQV